VADLPEDLAKVLAELEARKRSLRNRLQSIDHAIEGIQGLQNASSKNPAPEPKVPDFATLNRAVEGPLANEAPEEPVEAVAEAPQREQASDIHPAVQAPAELDPGECRDFVLQPDYPNSPAENPKALMRPIPKPEPERRKLAHLNVYVNQNTDWAARQMVSAQSPRAVFRHKTGHKCPKCGSADTRLSLTRGIADCFMFLFDYSIARCRACDSRFRIWRSRDEEEGEQELEPQTHPTSPK